MASVRLTKTVADAAAPRTDKPKSDLYLWDGGKGFVSGFGFKVTPAGGKSFVFQYRMRGAKADRRYKIGKYGDWTVETARDRAKELRRMVDAGVDPLEHDKAQVKAAEKAKRDAVDRAFDVVADRWVDEYKVERRTKGARKGLVRRDATIEMVETAVAYLKKVLGKRRIDELDDFELMAMINKIPPEMMAKRRNTFAVARPLWKWAHRQRLITENPFDRMEAPPAPASRDRVLSNDELAIFWRATRKLPYPFGPVFRLLALTAQRRSEVTGMRWEELDRKTSTWVIPADRTKNGLVHLVPISTPVLEELDAIARSDKWPAKGYVFTVTGKSPVSGHSAAKRRLDAGMGEIMKQEKRGELALWRVHDLRRTVTTNFQRLGVRFEVTEAVLNHISGSRGGVAGIYQQYEWEIEKAEALDAWSGFLLRLARPRLVEEAESVTA